MFLKECKEASDMNEHLLANFGAGSKMVMNHLGFRIVYDRTTDFP